MRTHISKQSGCRSALALLWVLAGSAALGQTPGGMPADGSASSSSGASKFSERKVTIDVEGKRLVEVIPDLMKSVEAEFTIDADVKNARVSSHLTNVKLQTVLDVLMRVSDLPVQVAFEKGVFHFSKKVEMPPDPAPALPPAHLPGESLLPPPPTQLQEEVGVHNVQTYDLLRVLNGLFNVPIEIDPDPNADAHGAPNGYGNSSADYTGFTNSRGSSLNGNGFSTSGGGALLGGPGNNSGNRTQNGSGSMTIFGHTFHLGGR